MLRNLVLWHQRFRVAGTCDAETAIDRIQSLIAREARRIGLDERLMGRLDGRQLKVWRSAPLAQLGDTVELVAELREDGEGSAVEGVLRYRLRTRVQFIGCLLFAVLLALVGVLRSHGEAGSGTDLMAIGACVALATLFWIYSSKQMIGHQARFIRERLERALAGKGDAS